MVERRPTSNNAVTRELCSVPAGASVLLSEGVSIKELAAYLGHADPGFTLRTDTHLVPSSLQRARAALDGVFAPIPDGLITA